MISCWVRDRKSFFWVREKWGDPWGAQTHWPLALLDHSRPWKLISWETPWRVYWEKERAETRWKVWMISIRDSAPSLDRSISLWRLEFGKTRFLQDFDTAFDVANSLGGREERSWENSSGGRAKIGSLRGPLRTKYWILDLLLRKLFTWAAISDSFSRRSDIVKEKRKKVNWEEAREGRNKDLFLQQAAQCNSAQSSPPPNSCIPQGFLNFTKNRERGSWSRRATAT